MDHSAHVRKNMPTFLLMPAENGGWVVMDDHRFRGEMPTPIAAYSNDAEMVRGVEALVSNRRLASAGAESGFAVAGAIGNRITGSIHDKT